MVDVCLEFRRSVVGCSVDEVWRRLFACCVRVLTLQGCVWSKSEQKILPANEGEQRALIGSPPDCAISFLYWVLRRNP